ncbi:hypothetical protein ACFP56_13815 [Paenibacillus septentrionalis]|uniref:Uncharacterized protein n=1 Tax=Paenibacillus septentrionalis TaxID=429342 RepID=A0ABW1V8B6_9BACL
MVKCYYMNGSVPEKGYNEDSSLLIMIGFVKSELVIRDANRIITASEYKAYQMKTYLPESDNHSMKYIISDKKLAYQFLTRKKCKMLCEDRSITDDNVIDYILDKL